MKTIGLIGGMSWESSAVYYKLLNKIVKKKLGEDHSCDCLMYSVDFAPIKKLQHDGEWNKLTMLMIEASKRLEKGGADMLVICTNTMHMMAPDIESSVDIPLLHIADAAAVEIKKAKLERVLLLGTRFTMEKEFYKGRLKDNHGIEVMIPDPGDIDIVHNIIYKELIMGDIREESRMEYSKIISKMIDRGAEGVVLGCTEIPLLINQEQVDVPIYDTTTIHANRAVEIAIN
jgi:aspartate racemase